MRRFRRTYNFSTPSWLRDIQTMLGDFIIPIAVFQALRTLIFPTFFDFILLAVLIGLAVKTYYQP
ncbi:hypothetical protein [Ectobacillus ponti]|uniref:Uncharacterized protein n=1 Tax=Ectobacillus ponti TaxID=2961894 RepID=A0AA41X6S4_9BACI|nr:hypothetical protein [Ectobacillus ponti]MCP8967328.1 hypothetical protein [Ectobacillus ponti]